MKNSENIAMEIMPIKYEIEDLKWRGNLWFIFSALLHQERYYNGSNMQLRWWAQETYAVGWKTSQNATTLKDEMHMFTSLIYLTSMCQLHALDSAIDKRHSDYEWWVGTESGRCAIGLYKY